jgi:hypothetical protein
MPRGDGTGPMGKDRRGGQGGGGGSGGQGGGRMGGYGLGPGGKCVCPNCGARQDHQRGVPCNSLTCPKCGAAMTRAR